MYKQLLPLLDIKLKHDSRIVSTLAYVDSGALDSIFNAELARILEMDYRKGEELKPLGLGGHITAYLNDITLIINGKRIETRVLFSDHIKFSFNLLGMNSFFNYFKVCFDNKNGELVLEEF